MEPLFGSSGVTFLIHNHKCGGNSLERALIDTGTKYVKTDDIVIDSSSPIYRAVTEKKSVEPVLIFGHPDRVRQSNSHEKNANFFRDLYWNSRIICPSRRPILLTISWLEYTRTRLINFITGRAEQYNQNPESITKYKFLWQQYSGCAFNQAAENNFEHPHLDPKENVFRWIDVVSEHTIYHFIQSYNLFFPISGDIIRAVKSGTRKTLPIDGLISPEKFFIYDAERYSEVAVATLAKEIGPGFVDALTQSRLNASHKSLGSLSDSDLTELQGAQDRLCDLDSQIYARAV